MGPVEIIEMVPHNATATMRFLGESISVRLYIKIHDSEPSCVTAELVTNIPSQDVQYGVWHHVSMKLLPGESVEASRKYECCVGVFMATLLPPIPGHFEFTARARYCSDEWLWAGKYQQNAFMNILEPMGMYSWAKGAQYVEILPGLYLGNLVAANDPSLGFEAILNMGEEIDVHFDVSRSGSVVYHKIPLVDGPSNPIPAEAILDAVRWIENHRAMKMLIHCRAGRFRSASIVISYMYKVSGRASFDNIIRTLRMKRPEAAPHRNLRHTLEKITWEDAFSDDEQLKMSM